ncbi:MAG: sortase [Chloroflexota bacterium]
MKLRHYFRWLQSALLCLNIGIGVAIVALIISGSPPEPPQPLVQPSLEETEQVIAQVDTNPNVLLNRPTADITLMDRLDTGLYKLSENVIDQVDRSQQAFASATGQVNRSSALSNSADQPRDSSLNVSQSYLDSFVPASLFEESNSPTVHGSLTIPKISLSNQIEHIPLVNSVWDITDLGAKIGLLEGTGRHPEDDQAMVFAGHAAVFWPLRGPFADLQKLLPGDEVIYIHENKRYKYEVSRLVFADPSRVDLILDKGGDQLVLVTCGNVDFSTGLAEDRLIVTADLVSVDELIFDQSN